MKVSIYYESGSIDVVDTTMLSYHDGALVDDCFVGVGDIENTGLTIERNVYNTDSEHSERTMLSSEPIRIVTPDELERVVLVMVDGDPILLRDENGRFMRCAMDHVAQIRQQYAQM